MERLPKFPFGQPRRKLTESMPNSSFTAPDEDAQKLMRQKLGLAQSFPDGATSPVVVDFLSSERSGSGKAKGVLFRN